MDYIIGAVLLVIFVLAIVYIVRQKKKGTACIGCPCSSTCGKTHCGAQEEQDCSSCNQ